MSGEENENANFDLDTVSSFGEEWGYFDQTDLDERELYARFDEYFHVFPWDNLQSNPEGFDMGCGSGRWAQLVLPRVGILNCIDPSDEALGVARDVLTDFTNARFIHAGANNVPLENESQDFGYSLGVLHHIPDTASALSACVKLLKPNSPFLLYLYYRFENRPAWFRAVWKTSELFRSIICRLPGSTKRLVTDPIAFLIYWPLARLALLGEKLGISTKNISLYYYRDKSFYTMRTDSRDRFGTPLEKRFTRAEITELMEEAGLVDIVISDREPYWCAVGTKPASSS